MVRTIESYITDELHQIAPAIAIGDPSRRAPSEGAYRDYYSDYEWRVAAQRFMEEAFFIVYIAGESESVMWELAKLQEMNLLSNTLIIFQQNSSEINCQILRLVEETTRIDLSRIGKINALFY